MKCTYKYRKMARLRGLDKKVSVYTLCEWLVHAVLGTKEGLEKFSRFQIEVIVSTQYVLCLVSSAPGNGYRSLT